MGDVVITSVSNSILVKLDKPYYLPGDAVEGYVLLNAINAFDAAELSIEVAGFEKAFWERRSESLSDSGETIITTFPRSGNRTMLCVKRTLPLACCASGALEPGRHQYPFSFILPHEGLPASCELTGATNWSLHALQAEICYKVQAACVAHGGMTPIMRGEAKITVLQQRNKPPTPKDVKVNFRMKSCFCRIRGHVMVTVQCDKDMYMPGETAKITLQVDNQSDYDFKNTRLQLIQGMRLTSNGGDKYSGGRKVLVHHEPGVRRGDQMVWDDDKHLSLTLPHDLPPSTIGQVIECGYCFKVKLKAPVCAADVAVTLPIIIDQARPQDQGQIQQPQSLKPRVIAPVCRLVIPTPPPAPPSQQVIKS